MILFLSVFSLIFALTHSQSVFTPNVTLEDSSIYNVSDAG